MRIRTGCPAASSFSSRSASGLERASAGMVRTLSAIRMPPVWASRLRSVPIERMTTATAPSREDSSAPPPRTATAVP